MGKSTPVKPVAKGKAKATTKAAPKKAAAAKSKGQAKAKAKALTKSALKNHEDGGAPMSLKEKMEKLLADVDPAKRDEVMDTLADSLSKLDKSKIWGQHNTALGQGDPKAKQEFDDLPKKDKGKASLLWYLQHKGPERFRTMTMEMSARNTFVKTEKWVSEKKMLDEFGQTSFDRHLASGRIIWRQCKVTPGEYEYQDTADEVKTRTVVKSKTLQEGQEFKVDEADKLFLELFAEAETENCFPQKALWEATESDISKGGKGKGKLPGPKGKGKGKQLAIENGDPEEEPEEPKEPTPEELLADALQKARKMRDLCGATVANMEEQLAAVAKSKYWSKQAQKDAAALKDAVAQAHDILKKVVVKKNPTLEEVKEKIVAAATAVKTANGQIKDIRMIASKASSVASGR